MYAIRSYYAVQFQVSRPSLREAIQRLEAKGLLYRRQGGGTYVRSELSSGLADPLFELLVSHPESQFDLLEFRHVLEGVAAYYAALRGTEVDFERIRAIQLQIEAAQQQGDLAGEAHAVAEFYLVITSYSIHYTKLYEAPGRRDLRAQRAEQWSGRSAVRAAGQPPGIPVRPAGVPRNNFV